MDRIIFIEEGKELGLEGAELQKYASERERDVRAIERQTAQAQAQIAREEREAQVQRAREEREAQIAREEREAQIAREEREAQAQIAREEREAQIAREEHEAQAQIAREERAFQLERLRLEREGANTPSSSQADSFWLTEQVRMVPRFNEKEVDTYFTSFENIAVQIGWPEDQWTLLLHRVLEGKALTVYTALSFEDQRSYPQVKDAIQRAYELVPEAYRKKFRNRGKNRAETYLEFAHAKSELLDRWVKSSEAHGEYEKLRELILVEAVRNDLSTEIRDYVDLRQVSTAKEVAKAADEYTTNRSDRTPTRDRPFPVVEGRERAPVGSKPEAPRCRGCGKLGHIQENCRSTRPVVSRDNGPWMGRDMRPKCFNCGRLGTP